MMGFCVGDALGVPFEFKIRDSFPPVLNLVGYGTHYKPPGTWSDDSSLSFCLIEALIDRYNLETIKDKYINWLFNGFWTFDGQLPFDVGETTYSALSNLKTGTNMSNVIVHGENNNGNGALMRILPLMFYVKDMPLKERVSIINEVSGITHTSLRSKLACNIYIELAIQLEKGLSLTESYNHMKRNIYLIYRDIINLKNKISFHWFQEKHLYRKELKHFSRILRKDISLQSRKNIRSSGYVVDSLEATIWCLLTTSSYKEAVLTAVNLGGDTDTIASLVGGLAGLYYGKVTIPEEWLSAIARKEDIEDLCRRYAVFLSDAKNEKSLI